MVHSRINAILQSIHECRLASAQILCAVMCLFLGTSVHAADQVVTSNANSGAGSLRQAVADVHSGGTITFNLGGGSETITLTGGELSIAGKTVTILGDNSAGSGTAITISGNNASRIFNVSGGGTLNATSLTLTNGNEAADFGGAIQLAGSNATLRACTISNSQSGGANTGGGGVYIDGTSTLTTLYCTFSNCDAVSTSGDGGAIFLASGGTANHYYTTFTGCDALDRGGGIRIFDGAATVLNIYNCTFYDNDADSGGAIHIKGGTASIRYSTIIGGNTGTANGRALQIESGTLKCHASIISRLGGSGTTAFYSTGGTLDTTGIWGQNNVIETQAGAPLFNGGTNTVGSDPLVNALASNGGLTQTCSLGAASPARDVLSGDNTPDQRCYASDGNRDVGAFEYGSTTGLAGGNGSAASPWQVNSIAGLQAIAYETLWLGDRFIQTADIDASATSGWNAGAGFQTIGYDTDNGTASFQGTMFTGQYNGQGYTIRGLIINRPTEWYVGLFGYTSGATIENVAIENSSVNGLTRSGGLAGYIASGTTISKCCFDGAVTGGASNWFGGLVGVVNASTVSDSYSLGSVSSTSTCVGGLTAYVFATGTVSRCYAAVEVSGASQVGGLIGNNVGATITNCYWDTSVAATGIGTGTAAGTGLSTSNMYRQASFGGWDFATVWAIHQGSTYPYLRNVGRQYVAPSGYCLDFDGADDYVTCPAMNLNTNTATFETWIYRDGAQADYAGIVFCRGGSTVSGIHIRTSGKIGYHWNDSGYSHDFGITIPDSTWCHVALVVTPTGVQMYFNGQPGTIDSRAISADAFDGALNLGRDPTGGRLFDGMIDEVRIWKTARTQDQIRENMCNYVSPSDPDLVAYYRLNEGSGTLTADLAGLYDGTLTSMDPATDWVASTAFNVWQGDDGTTPTDWSDTDNWSRGVVPGGTDNVSIPVTGNNPNLTALSSTGSLVIQSSAVLGGGGQTLNIGGEFYPFGTFTHGSGTVAFNGTGSQAIPNVQYHHLTINKASGTATPNANLDADGNFTITAGTFSALDKSLNVAGNWSNSGTFTAGTGSVVLDGTSQSISGSTTFNTLTKSVAAADTLTVANGTTQTVSSSLTLKGASGQLLRLRSNAGGSVWSINAPATQDVNFVDVQDSTNTGTVINVAAGIDSGNNTKWRLTPITQSTTLVFSSVGYNSFNVAWTRGDAARCAVFMTEATTGSASPVNGTTYTASNNWASKGDQIGATGWYCVYVGTGTSVGMLNLADGVTYRVMVCEYNGTTTDIVYLGSTASGNPSNQATLNDSSAPTLTVSTPCGNGATHYQQGATVNLGGTVSDTQTGLKEVRWSNSLGGSGLAAVVGGNWTVSGAAVAVGDNVFTVTAEDNSGNTSSVSLTVTRDNTAPAIVVSAPVAAGGTHSQNTATVNVSGTASDAASGVKRVTWENTTRGESGTATGTTAWSISNIALNSGDNTIVLTAEDNAGNTASGTITVHYDSVQPNLAVSTPAVTPFYTNLATTAMAGTSSDNVGGSGLASVTWSNAANGDNGTATLAGSNWNCTVAVDVGNNVVTLTATDNAGNTTTTNVTVFRDNTNPSVAITSPGSNPYNINALTITLSGTASDAQSGLKQASWANAETSGSGVLTVTAGSWTLTNMPLLTGANNVTITAEDNAGNTNTATIQIICDITDPTLVVTTPATNPYYTNANSINMSGTGAEAGTEAGLARVEWSNSTGGSGLANVPFANRYLYNWTFNGIGLAAGDNVLTFTGVDLTNPTPNQTVTTHTVHYDSTAPVLAITTPVATGGTYYTNTPTGKITFAGTADGATCGMQQVAWSNSGTSQSGSTTTGLANWSFGGLDLAFGTNTFSATATDKASNTSNGSITVIYDTNDPTLTVTAPCAIGGSVYQAANTVNLVGTAADTGGSALKEVRWANTTAGTSGTATGTTNWTQNAVALNSGDNLITITAEDNAGNTVSGTITVHYDSTGPALVISNPCAAGSTHYSSTTPVDVTGTVTDGGSGVNQVTWTGPNAQSGTATLVGSSWSINNINLNVGNNTITVTARDNVNNTSVGSITVNYDPNNPAITVDTPCAIGATHYQNTNTVNVTGTALDSASGSGLQDILWANTTTSASGTATGTTNWSVSNIALLAGDNTINITARDNVNNTRTVTITVHYDPATPTIIVTTPNTTPYYVQAAVIGASGTASDNVGGSGLKEVRWANSTTGGNGVATGTATWSCAIIPLNIGNNSISFTVEDLAGNTQSSAIVVHRDATPPNIAITTPATDPYNTPLTSVSLAGTASDGGSGIKEVRWTNALTTQTGTVTVTAGNWTLNNTLFAGHNVISFTAEDMSGNTKTDTVEVICDVTGPTIVVTSPVDNPYYTNLNAVNVSGNAAETASETGLTFIEWSNDQGGSGNWAVPGAQKFMTSWTFNAIGLVAGNNVLTFTGRDAVNNTRDTAITVHYDSVAPNVAVVSPIAAGGTLYTNTVTAKVDISGTASDASSGLKEVRWVNAESTQTGSTMAGMANWSFAGTSLVFGTNTYTVTAEDQSGNTATSSIVVYYDTTRPTLTLTSPTSSFISTVQPTTVVVGTSADGQSGISTLQWTNTTTGATDTIAATANWTVTVPLSFGENDVSLVLTDRAGNTDTKTFTVLYWAHVPGPGPAPSPTDPDTSYYDAEITDGEGVAVLDNNYFTSTVYGFPNDSWVALESFPNDYETSLIVYDGNNEAILETSLNGEGIPEGSSIDVSMDADGDRAILVFDPVGTQIAGFVSDAGGIGDDEKVIITVDADGQWEAGVWDPHDAPRFVVRVDGEGATMASEIRIDIDAFDDRNVWVGDEEGPLALFDIVGDTNDELVRVLLKIDADGKQVLTFYRSTGREVTVSTNLEPASYRLELYVGPINLTGVGVLDTGDDAFDVVLDIDRAGLRPDFEFLFIQDPGDLAKASTSQRGTVVGGFEGLGYGIAYGGAVEIRSSGVPTIQALTVRLVYDLDDVETTEVNEAALRTYVWDVANGRFTPAGSSDAGDEEPTGTIGDYGIDTQWTEVWVEREALGTFAIGADESAYSQEPDIPDPDVPDPGDPNSNDNDSPDDPDDNANSNVNDNSNPSIPAGGTPGGCGAGMCGAMGGFNLAMLLVGMAVLRRRR